MSLTKIDKEAFVRAVMDDVPKHDFDEMAQLIVIGHFKKVLPKKVFDVAEDKATRDYLERKYVSMPNGLNDFYSRYRPLGFQGWGALPEDVKVRLLELATFKKEQDKTRSSLRAEVAGMIEPVTTLKAALAKLPEFAKYLPAERGVTGTTNLPAERGVTGTTNLPVANVVAELNKAGWPKKENLYAKKTTA